MVLPILQYQRKHIIIVKKGYDIRLQDFFEYDSIERYDVVVLNESFFYLGRSLMENMNAKNI